jgi:ATP synthase F1 delta subunit
MCLLLTHFFWSLLLWLDGLVQTAVRSFAAATDGDGGADKDEYNPWNELNNARTTLGSPVHQEGEYAQYASTAFVHGNGAKALEAIQKDFAVVTGVLKDPATRQFFQDPSVSTKDKQSALDAITEEGKLHEISAAVLAILNDDGAVANIGEVSKAFGVLMSAHRGEVRATVTSAEPLSAADTKAVQTALRNRLKKGQTLVLEQLVDAQIMGGLLVELGNEFADLSVRSSVEDINQALRE